MTIPAFNYRIIEVTHMKRLYFQFNKKAGAQFTCVFDITQTAAAAKITKVFLLALATSNRIVRESCV